MSFLLVLHQRNEAGAEDELSEERERERNGRNRRRRGQIRYRIESMLHMLIVLIKWHRRLEIVLNSRGLFKLVPPMMVSMTGEIARRVENRRWRKSTCFIYEHLEHELSNGGR
jgi:hypothetical protein